LDEGARSYLEALNPAQRSAVEHGSAGTTGAPPSSPLLIIAGAGSGKTKTLAHRVAHLLVNGVDPERLLLLTFTRRAAQEIRSALAVEGRVATPGEAPESLVDQLNDALERFEGSHPRLTQLVGRIADSLSDIGI